MPSTTTARLLHAGPVSAKFQDGELRYLCVGGREVLRRVYFAVRDSRWDTVMPVFDVIEVEDDGDHFRVRLAARCRNDIADYTWTGEMTGTTAGEITFTVAGESVAAFASPRIGICMLFGHALAGQSYALLDGDAATPGVFPTHVEPAMLAELNSFRLLRYTADGMTVTAGLADGGRFGMEDQRNYGDASYKAMSDMAYPYPAIAAHAAARQTFVLRVDNPVAGDVYAGPPRITLGDVLPGARLPRLIAPAQADGPYDLSAGLCEIDRLAAMDPVVAPFCPALHMPDDDTFMENPPALVDWVATVRAALPGRRVCIDPVTLDSPYPRPARDPRNVTRFAAAWALRVLKYLALAGVDEAAFTLGPGPADDLLAAAGALAGAPLLDARITRGIPESVDALAVLTPDGPLLWIANLTDTRQVPVLEIAGEQMPVPLAPYGMLQMGL